MSYLFWDSWEEKEKRGRKKLEEFQRKEEEEQRQIKFEIMLDKLEKIKMDTKKLKLELQRKEEPLRKEDFVKCSKCFGYGHRRSICPNKEQITLEEIQDEPTSVQVDQEVHKEDVTTEIEPIEEINPDEEGESLEEVETTMVQDDKDALLEESPNPDIVLDTPKKQGSIMEDSNIELELENQRHKCEVEFVGLDSFDTAQYFDHNFFVQTPNEAIQEAVERAKKDLKLSSFQFFQNQKVSCSKLWSKLLLQDEYVSHDRSDFDFYLREGYGSLIVSQLLTKCFEFKSIDLCCEKKIWLDIGSLDSWKLDDHEGRIMKLMHGFFPTKWCIGEVPKLLSRLEEGYIAFDPGIMPQEYPFFETRILWCLKGSVRDLWFREARIHEGALMLHAYYLSLQELRTILFEERENDAGARCKARQCPVLKALAVMQLDLHIIDF